MRSSVAATNQDDYYDWDREYNFRDRDVLIAGPERAMAANFDAFWHARRSVPAERLNDVGRTLLREGVPTLPPASAAPSGCSGSVPKDMDFVSRSFVDTALPVASVRYVADLPRKHRREGRCALAGQHVTEPQLDALIAGAQEEVILQTPYLVLSAGAEAVPRAAQAPAAAAGGGVQQQPGRHRQPDRMRCRTSQAAQHARTGLQHLRVQAVPLDAPVDYRNLLPRSDRRAGVTTTAGAIR